MKHKSAWILWKFQKKVFVNRSNTHVHLKEEGMQNVYCYTLLHCPQYTRNYCSCTSKQTCSCSHSVYEPVNTLPGKCNRVIFVHKPPFTLKHNFTQTNSKGSQTNLHKQMVKNGLRFSVFSYAGNVVYFTN